VIQLEDIRVRKIFTLLSACVKNDLPMMQIVIEKMRQSEEYHLLSSLDEFVFLSDQGRNLERRVRNFKLVQQKNLARTYNLLNNLNSLASEFKNVLNESRNAAEEPINRDYREVHILEQNYLQIRLKHDERTLNKSEVYRLWQDRNDYLYENDVARRLKVDMDFFQCSIVTKAKIHLSYAALESFQNRFQQNRSQIISVQESRKRKNAQAEQERARADQERAIAERNREQEKARLAQEQKKREYKAQSESEVFSGWLKVVVGFGIISINIWAISNASLIPFGLSYLLIVLSPISLLVSLYLVFSRFAMINDKHNKQTGK
jgi:sRNA-binding protein